MDSIFLRLFYVEFTENFEMICSKMSNNLTYQRSLLCTCQFLFQITLPALQQFIQGVSRHKSDII